MYQDYTENTRNAIWKKRDCIYLNNVVIFILIVLRIGRDISIIGGGFNHFDKLKRQNLLLQS